MVETLLQPRFIEHEWVTLKAHHRLDVKCSLSTHVDLKPALTVLNGWLVTAVGSDGGSE